METLHLSYIIPAVVYSLLGILIMLITFVAIEKIAPENLWKQIIVEKNVSLALIASSLMIAMAIIISSAIHS